jgi:hypothetical protein
MSGILKAFRKPKSDDSADTTSSTLSTSRQLELAQKRIRELEQQVFKLQLELEIAKKPNEERQEYNKTILDYAIERIMDEEAARERISVKKTERYLREDGREAEALHFKKQLARSTSERARNSVSVKHR